MPDLSPEKVDAFIKAMQAMNSIHPLIGVAVALVGLITGILTLINSFRTKKNTEVNTQTTAMMEELKADIQDVKRLKEDAVREVRSIAEEFSALVKTTREQFAEDARQFKLGVASQKVLVDQKLSQIPKIQDAIEALRKQNLDTAYKAADTESKVEQMLQVIKRARGGSR